VIKSTIISKGIISNKDFTINNHGAIIRTGITEGLEEIEEAENVGPVVLGRGRRAKVGTKKYGAEWEGH
jgi:hypothetical protein